MFELDSDDDVPLSMHRRAEPARAAVLEMNGHEVVNGVVQPYNRNEEFVKSGRLPKRERSTKSHVQRKRKMVVEESDDDWMNGARDSSFDGDEDSEERNYHSEDDDDDKILAPRLKRMRRPNGEEVKEARVKSESRILPDTSYMREQSTDRRAVKQEIKLRKAKLKAEPKTEPNARALKKENTREDGRHRWWDGGESGGDGVKWNSLQHNGVVFPPEYEPHGVPLVYDGVPLHLEPYPEEVATYYAAKLDSEHVKKDIFNRNFFKDFRSAMKGTAAYKIVRRFDLCDFSRIKSLLDERSAAKKSLTLQERKALKQEETERVKKYTTCIVDGRVEKVGNFRVEPPGLFLGRGQHPKTGMVKARIYPEDITINIGRDDPVPECPIPGHRWGNVVHNNNVTWLAGWKDSITGGTKYVFLGADSTFKGQSDRAKFEKARLLKNYVDKIRSDYRKVWTARVSKEVRQRSIALYLIDKLALRVGNEKGDDEADTVGCCSLRVEHLKFIPPRTVEFDFLGKDSIRYQNSVEVEPEVYGNLKRFCRGKAPGENVFHRLTVTDLNNYLKELMPGLSAKVFRTYNASIVLDELLQKTPEKTDVNNKLVFYNRANRDVAELCNHQKTVSTTHNASMEKLELKLKDAKEWLRTLKRAKAELSKDPNKRTIDVIQKVRPKPEFKDSMNQAARAAERLRAEKAPPIKKKRTMKMETLKSTLVSVKQRIQKIETQMTVKEDLKTVSLGTSKMNYLDPRISVAWCKKYEVPIEKIFAKTLMTKFAWAMEEGEDFRF